MRQEIMVFWDGSGIGWTICKLSALRSRQITTATPRQSIFTGQTPFLTPSQQCQSTEGTTASCSLLTIQSWTMFLLESCVYVRVGR